MKQGKLCPRGYFIVSLFSNSTSCRGRGEVGAGAGSWLDTRWVREIRNLVEVTPKEDEAGTDAEEYQSCPKADVVEGLPHAHPVGHFL